MAAVGPAPLQDLQSQAYTRIRHFAIVKRRRPFSPLWEMYVYALSQPTARRYLEAHQEGTFRGLADATLNRYWNDLSFHPFNLCNADLNAWRAQELLAMLEAFLRPTNRRRRERPHWWPRDAAALVELIKKEREEMDTLGYIDVGGRGKAEGGEGLSTTRAGEDEVSSSQTVSSLKRKHTE